MMRRSEPRSEKGLHVRAWSATSVGRVREGNEDSLYRGRTTFAVADGMGGHQAGEVASETALKPVAKLDDMGFATPQEATAALVEAVSSANQSVFEKASDDPELRGMGTTLTALLVRDGRFHLAHVGDSRAYLLRPGEPISRLTTDHTLVQQLIDEGRLSSDEADTHPQRSVITRAIGVERSVEVDTLEPLRMLPGDQILLCSDGLTGPVKDEEIARILTEHEDGQQAVQALIDAANAAGGPDNITVVLLRVEGELPSGDHYSVGARSGDTQDLGPPIASTSGSAPTGSITRIRTRPEETGEFDAKTFGRYGGPQGAEDHPVPGLSGTLRRVLGGAVGVLILAGVLIGGAYLVFTRAYFVGDADGRVTIFRGFPQEVAGFPLNTAVEGTTVATADLPPLLQNRIRAGITMDSADAARDYVQNTLVPRAEETRRAREAPEPTPLPPPFPAPSPGSPEPGSAPRSRPAQPSPPPT